MSESASFKSPTEEFEGYLREQEEPSTRDDDHKPPLPKKTILDVFGEMGGTFGSRADVYKDNHKRLGNVMASLFPAGITLRNDFDHQRFAFLVLKVVKLTRYCVQFNQGGHADSLQDEGVYTAMLQLLDHNGPDTPF